MNPTLITHLRTLLAHPDHPDQNALFAVFDNGYASAVLACLAPPGSLLQIAAALHHGWSWDGDGWERQIDELVVMITDPRCPAPQEMMSTWRRVSGTVGVLHDRTDDLFAWAQKRLSPLWYSDLAILLGPSNASARLLVQSLSPSAIGRTLQRWSMAIAPDDPTAWQAMIDPDLRTALHRRADPASVFPAWGWVPSVNPEIVLLTLVDDLVTGWSPDHPAIRGQIAWLERHVDADLDDVVHLARLASIASSDALAEVVCVRLGHNPSSVPWIARIVPWSRLHPRIQTVIDTTMRRSSNAQWKRTWACALGQAPLVPDNDIDPTILLWRIDPERWKALDSKLRADLVARSVFPSHCYGWGVHPDPVAGGDFPNGQVFRFWNPDIPADDLRAWVYADLLLKQTSRQNAQAMIALLDSLPPNRRARFEQIIDWRLVSRSEPTDQSTWDWTVWSALPAADRQRRLRDRMHALWGDRTTKPAYRVWMARSHLLDTVVIAVRDLLDSRRAPRILAALLAQIPALRVHMPNPEPPLPFPDDLDAARRAQIERLPISPNEHAYAAWCLRVLEQDMGLGSTLIALHPTIAVALAPILSPDQQKAVAASPAAQGWESMTFLSWAVACAPAQESPMSPVQRRLP